MTSRPFSYACAAFFLLALLLGGASRDEVFTSDIVAAASTPLLAWAIWRLSGKPVESAERLPLLILAGCFLVGLLQLIPLPAGLWAALPGRERIAAELAMAGVDRTWAPLSLTPQATVSTLMALVPAAAVFLATRTLSASGRRLMILVLFSVAAASAIVGALQVLGGQDSPLRFYAVTNPNPAVGFFANRNHLASLLACAIPFALVEAIASLRDRGRTRASGLALAGGVLLLAVVGIAMTQSRAGLLLAGLALVGGLALAWRSELKTGRWPLIIAGVGVVAALALAPVVFAGAFARIEDGVQDSLRLDAVMVGAEAAWAFAPLGAGLGSFVPVYMMFETPAVMQNTYLNHAHNDWLELLIETGLPGLLLMLAFLVWFVLASRRAWRPRESIGPIARAASLAIVFLMVHSLVDYPLRTPAVLCLFALACGLLLPPRAADGAQPR
jgi:O-antigen ligase